MCSTEFVVYNAMQCVSINCRGRFRSLRHAPPVYAKVSPLKCHPRKTRHNERKGTMHKVSHQDLCSLFQRLTRFLDSSFLRFSDVFEHPHKQGLCRSQRTPCQATPVPSFQRVFQATGREDESLSGIKSGQCIHLTSVFHLRPPPRSHLCAPVIHHDLFYSEVLHTIRSAIGPLH